MTGQHNGTQTENLDARKLLHEAFGLLESLTGGGRLPQRCSPLAVCSQVACMTFSAILSPSLLACTCCLAPLLPCTLHTCYQKVQHMTEDMSWPCP